MEFFSLFSTVFFNIAIIVGLLLLIYLFFFSGIRARKDLKPMKYISYKKDHFQKNFEFTCEFCGSKVSSTDEKCSTCGGNFGKNKEYQLKKRAMYQRYLEYMKAQEEVITQETEYISNTMQAIQKYKLIRHKYYNLEIGEPPVNKHANDYEFTCEYCDNKIRGKSTDETGCSNCGASYKENLELLVREEEDRLEKRHYDEYMKLKYLEWEQNTRNERRDANIDEKYGTPIRFMEKNAKGIALVILLGLMMISVGITVLILKFR